MRCIDCSEFIPPDAQYEPNSLGLCSVMDRWLDRFPQRRPKPAEYDKNYARLGGRPCWPLVERTCEKHRMKS
jgi:hypothetical protein